MQHASSFFGGGMIGGIVIPLFAGISKASRGKQKQMDEIMRQTEAEQDAANATPVLGGDVSNHVGSPQRKDSLRVPKWSNLWSPSTWGSGDGVGLEERQDAKLLGEEGGVDGIRTLRAVGRSASMGNLAGRGQSRRVTSGGLPSSEGMITTRAQAGEARANLTLLCISLQGAKQLTGISLRNHPGIGRLCAADEEEELQHRPRSVGASIFTKNPAISPLLQLLVKGGGAGKLQWLDLSGCALGDHGCAAVALALASQHCGGVLCGLDLSRNDVGDGVELAEALLGSCYMDKRRRVVYMRARRRRSLSDGGIGLGSPTDTDLDDPDFSDEEDDDIDAWATPVDHISGEDGDEDGDTDGGSGISPREDDESSDEGRLYFDDFVDVEDDRESIIDEPVSPGSPMWQSDPSPVEAVAAAAAPAPAGSGTTRQFQGGRSGAASASAWQAMPRASASGGRPKSVRLSQARRPVSLSRSNSFRRSGGGSRTRSRGSWQFQLGDTETPALRAAAKKAAKWGLLRRCRSLRELRLAANKLCEAPPAKGHFTSGGGEERQPYLAVHLFNALAHRTRSQPLSPGGEKGAPSGHVSSSASQRRQRLPPGGWALRVLDLSSNNLNNSLTMHSLINMVEHDCVLRCIDLSGNHLPRSFFQTLALIVGAGKDRNSSICTMLFNKTPALNSDYRKKIEKNLRANRLRLMRSLSDRRSLLAVDAAVAAAAAALRAADGAFESITFAMKNPSEAKPLLVLRCDADGNDLPTDFQHDAELWVGSMPLDVPPTPLHEPVVQVSRSYSEIPEDAGADYLADSLLTSLDELSGATSPFKRWAATLQHTSWVTANYEWCDAELRVPYIDLERAEQIKDDDMVRIATLEFERYLADLWDALGDAGGRANDFSVNPFQRVDRRGSADATQAAQLRDVSASVLQLTPWHAVTRLDDVNVLLSPMDKSRLLMEDAPVPLPPQQYAAATGSPLAAHPHGAGASPTRVAALSGDSSAMGTPQPTSPRPRAALNIGPAQFCRLVARIWRRVRQHRALDSDEDILALSHEELWKCWERSDASGELNVATFSAADDDAAELVFAAMLATVGGVEEKEDAAPAVEIDVTFGTLVPVVDEGEQGADDESGTDGGAGSEVGESTHTSPMRSRSRTGSGASPSKRSARSLSRLRSRGGGSGVSAWRRRVATELHDSWREARPKTADGLMYAPRHKDVDGRRVDIANISFDELPAEFQLSNMRAAKATCRHIELAFVAALVAPPLDPEAASQWSLLRVLDRGTHALLAAAPEVCDLVRDAEPLGSTSLSDAGVLVSSWWPWPHTVDPLVILEVADRVSNRKRLGFLAAAAAAAAAQSAARSARDAERLIGEDGSVVDVQGGPPTASAGAGLFLDVAAITAAARTRPVAAAVRSLGRRQLSKSISVFFSSPLVYFSPSEHGLVSLIRSNHSGEHAMLRNAFHQRNSNSTVRDNVQLRFSWATTSQMRKEINAGVTALHFSGHGSSAGGSLAFEDGAGMTDWVPVRKMQGLVNPLTTTTSSSSLGAAAAGSSANASATTSQDGRLRPHPTLQLAFISSCFSQEVGDAFVAAGVPHVVCVRQDSEILDKAAEEFTNHFYNALAAGRSVADAFEDGKLMVGMNPAVRRIAQGEADAEADKFVLLPLGYDHSDVVFPTENFRNRSDSASSMEMPPTPTIVDATTVATATTNGLEDLLPPLIESFLGRNVATYNLLQKILENRNVTVYGKRGAF